MKYMNVSETERSSVSKNLMVNEDRYMPQGTITAL